MAAAKPVKINNKEPTKKKTVNNKKIERQEKDWIDLGNGMKVRHN